jgi:hypothetical protein
MSRNRMTRRSSVDGLLSEIEGLERLFSAQEQVESPEDKALQQDADAITREDNRIVEEGMDVKVQDEGNQNEKAMDNWPLTAEEKKNIAGRLVAIAKQLLSE